MPAEFVSILPSSATPWMRALEQTSGERWAGLDNDIIRRVRDPWTCPVHLLNFLAHQRSVDLWDETWSEQKKRSVIASAPADHRLKGTESGTRRYLSIVDAKLRQVVTPPSGFFAARTPTVAEQNDYVRRLPEVRLYAHRQRGKAVGFFVGRSAAGHGHLVADRGRALLQRRATLFRDGQEAPLRLQQLGHGVERFVLAGDAGLAPVAGHAFAGRMFVGGERRQAETYTVAIEKVRDPNGALRLTAIRPGLDPAVPNIDRTFKRLPAGPAFILGRSFAGRDFALRDRAEEMLFDRIRLFDRTVAAPLYRGGGYAGHSRLSMPAHRAELLIERRSGMNRRHTFAGSDFAGRTHAAPTDLARFRKVLEAVAYSKRHSDRVLVSLETARRRALADGLDLNSGFRFGEQTARSL